MKDFLINLIFISIVLIISFYFKYNYTKFKSEIGKRKIISNFSKVMIILISCFSVFVLLSSLRQYYENILVNLIIFVIMSIFLIIIFSVKISAKRIYSKFQLILIAILIVISLLNVSTITNKTQFISKGDAIYIDQIESGDILFLHAGSLDSLLPGYWSHIGIVSKTDYDGVEVIEATIDGIHILSLEKFIGNSRISVAKLDNISHEKSDIVVNFAKDKIGLPYNFNLINKQIDNDRYYCSELIWASYKQINIDIDKNEGFYFKYFNAVAPQEIFGDSDLVIYHINKTLKNQIINESQL